MGLGSRAAGSHLARVAMPEGSEPCSGSVSLVRARARVRGIGSGFGFGLGSGSGL